MKPGFIVVISLLVLAQILLPRKWAFLPLLIGACHLGNVEIAGEMTASRILIILGLLRAVFTGDFRFSLSSPLDRIILTFCAFAVISAVGHPNSPFNPWIARIGLALNVFGSYLYARAFLPDEAAYRRFALVMPIVLSPLAAGLAMEKVAKKNFYSYLGSGSLTPMQRDDKLRAQGPFRHAILAGTAGATALPLAILFWRQKKRLFALFSAGVSMVIVFSCASSGPLAAVGVSILAAVLWRWRWKMRLFVISALSFVVFYWVMAGRGPWYIMASIDLVGGSTGWHRAKLFDQGFKYLADWWLFGTDYTRHWMATGVSWSKDHVDLTNYYLHLGVIGGIMLPALLVSSIVVASVKLYGTMKTLRDVDTERQVLLWVALSVILTHAISFVSISYFDQMYVLFYMALGATTGLVNSMHKVQIDDFMEVGWKK